VQTLQEIEPVQSQRFSIRTGSNRFLLLGGLFALLVLFAVLFPQTGDGDAVMHYINARDSLWMPAKLMGSWARVGDKIPLLIPAQFGVFAARCTAALISILCAWQTIRLAEDLDIPHANLAAVFLIFQPFVFSLAADTMTELPFALGIVIAIRLWLSERYLASSIVIGYLPTVRPEGFFLCTLWAVLLINKSLCSRRACSPYSVLLLPWGTLAWFFACWILRGDPQYFFREGWSWPADSLRVYGSGSFFSHVNRWPIYCGPVLLVLFIAGLKWNKFAAIGLGLLALEIVLPSPIRENLLPWLALALAGWFGWSIRQNRMAILAWVFLLIFTLHSILWWRGWYGSCGLMRILACVSPITAIVCLMGWNRFELLARKPHDGHRVAFVQAVLLIVIAGTAIAHYLVEPLHWRVFPLNRAARFAAENHLLDRAPIVIFGDPMALAALNLPPNPTNILPNDCNRRDELRHLLHAPIGSAGFWDNQHSEAWFHVSISDLPALGYTILDRREFRPPVDIEWLDPSKLPRLQTYVVIRKDRAGALPTN
jgi:hypothetical protein